MRVIFNLAPDGTILSATRKAARLTGIDCEELRGRDFRSFVIPADLAAYELFLSQAVTVRALQSLELTITPLGYPKVVVRLVNARPIDDSESRIVVVDMTLRIRIKEKIRRGNQALRLAEKERGKLHLQMLHVQRLESLGILASGIAHDVNNLLAPMLGFAEMARMQLPRESPVSMLLGQIENVAQRASDLTHQMLVYSGKGRSVTQPIRLDILLKEMIQLLEIAISRKVNLTLKLEPASIQGDATQLRQVVMNLIMNASDALGANEGEIEVRTGVRDADATDLSSRFIPEQLPAGSYAYVEVHDDGCGMAAETQQKIFDPFFTTKSTGRGLGLAAVLGIVRSHRGTIKVASALHEGTTFEVLLPCTRG